MKQCSIEGCNKLSDYINPQVCPMHYARARRVLIPEAQKKILHLGSTKKPEYINWKNIKARCTRPSHPQFPDYGGRGIIMSTRWQGKYGFSNFYADMGPRPSPKHSIDRIDNNGGYTPENCRWATAHQQSANRRNARKHVGVSKLRHKWSAKLKVNKQYVLNEYFYTEAEAIAARRAAEEKWLGA